MKLSASSIKTRRGQRAFTLVEALVASTTLVILTAAVIMANLFGLAMADRQQIWLGASDDAAQAVGTLMGDIRSAITLQVGTWQSGVFTPAVNTNQQSGSALIIYSTTNTTATGPSVLYYYDPSTTNLMRTNYNGPGVAGDYRRVSANPVTNDLTHPIFTEVDYTGTPLSTNTPLASVNIYLSFIRLQNPQIIIAPGNMVDLYQITTTVSPRLHL